MGPQDKDMPSPKRVLVIDDDPTILRLLEKWLTSAGYEPALAGKGLEGLEQARQVQPDCILLDLMIPDMSGGGVLRELKADPATRDIPVIFITITVSKKDDKIEKFIELDGQTYPVFAKPLYQPKLMSVIRKSIRRREAGG